MSYLTTRFSRKAVQYDTNALAQKSIAREFFNDFVKPQLLESKALNESLNIIDLGCGTGILTEKIVELISVEDFLIQLDFSEKMLIRSKEKMFNNQICGNIESLPILEKNFDFVLSSMVFHWTNLMNSFNQVQRILKNNGNFIFNLPIEGTFEYYNTLEFIAKPFNFESAYKVLEILVYQGFIIERHNIKNFIFTYDNLFSATNAIRNVGASGIDKNFSEFTTKKKNLNFIKNYKPEETFDLNYKIMQIHARKI